MKILSGVDQVEFTFGPIPRKIFSDCNAVLDPSEFSLEELVTELLRMRYKLVEAHRFRATPALTGTVQFLFRLASAGDRSISNAKRICLMLRGVMGESWRVQMARMPLSRDDVPSGHTVLRIHLMPMPEDRICEQREQAYACERG